MNDFIWLVRLYAVQMRNRMFSISWEKAIKLILIFMFAAIFFPVVHQLFYFIFKHFYAAPIIGGLMVNKLLGTFYLTFSIMIILSAIVSAIPVLYFSGDMDFLFSSPVKTESVFTVQYIKIIFNSCWMILLLAVPIFAAYLRVIKIDMSQYFFILLSHVPFFVVMASVGIMLTLILVKYFPASSIRNIAIAVFGIFVVVFILYFRMLQPEKLTGAGLNEIGEFLKNLRTPDHFLLPHASFMSLVKTITAYGVYRGLAPFFIYSSSAAVAFVVVIITAKYFYFDGYGKRGVYKKSAKKTTDLSLRKSFLFFSHFAKDFKYLIRDTTQWIQVVFLAGIVVIYLFNIYMLPAELFDLKNFIYFLNIGFIGLILSAIGARFILPVISTEGRGFWMFKAAPFSMGRYVFFKFVVYSMPIIITGQLIAVISIKMLKSDQFINFVTLYSTFFVTLVISGVGVGFAALFADFNIKNPEELITGAGGVAYMFITFLFVSGIMILEAGMVRDYYMSNMVKSGKFAAGDYLITFVVIAAAAAALTVISVFAGIKRLEKMEI